MVRVRTDIKPEVLCRALEATKALTVKHVIKNENGEEVNDPCDWHRTLVIHHLFIYRCSCPIASLLKQLSKMKKRILNHLRYMYLFAMVMASLDTYCLTKQLPDYLPEHDSGPEVDSDTVSILFTLSLSLSL